MSVQQQFDIHSARDRITGALLGTRWNPPLPLLVALTMLVGGCRRGAEPVPAASAKRVATSSRVDKSLVEQHAPPDVVPPMEEGESDGQQSPETSVEPPPMQFGNQRLVVLATGGPVIVDLAISIDGKPHTTAIEQLVDMVLEAADTDGDGRSTWKELTSNEQLLYGPLGQLRSGQVREANQWVEQFDLNANRVLERGEAASWLGRNTGRSVAPLSLDTRRSYYYDPRQNSASWKLLDTNQNGVLDQEELDRSQAVLASRDTDEDQIVQHGDLARLAEQLRMAGATEVPTMAGGRYDTDHHAALLVSPESDWYRVSYTLSSLYAAGKNLQAGCFAGRAELFAALDTDRNELLSFSELEALATIDADLAFEAFFGETSGDGESVVSERSTPLKLTSHSPSAGRLVSTAPARVSLESDGGYLVFAWQDLAPSMDFSQIASQQLKGLDRDLNGYLDPQEYLMQPGASEETFAAIDLDGDQMVRAEELAAYLELQQAVARSQLRLVVREEGDAVFGFLDANGDGRLGERELVQAPERLRELDRDRDDRIVRSELPGYMTVALVRGGNALGGRGEDLDVTISTPTAATGGPSWFVQGDFNRDGDLSRREFLGTAEQFAELDLDRNGFIDREEAEQVPE